MSANPQVEAVDREAWRDLALPAELAARRAPEIECEDVPNCPVCGDAHHATFTIGFDYELLTCSNPWRLVQCARCKHVWLNPRPAASTLPIIYPATYYAYNYEKAVNPLALRGKQLLDQLKLRAILRQAKQDPQNYLDVGCGNGRFLKAMERRGLARDRLYGLELEQSVVDALAAEGYRARCERVERCSRVADEGLDLITMFHVIEHVTDPAAVVRKLSSWLAPDGLLALETPNLDSADARWFQASHWGGYHIPRHWHLFTPESLKLLLDNAGLEVIGTVYQTGHAFWMYSLHHRLRFGDPPHPRAARWFDPFGGFLPLLIMFTGLDKLRAAARFRTSSMLMLARKRQPLAGS